MTDLEIEKELGFILLSEDISYQAVTRIYDLIRRVKRDSMQTTNEDE